MEIGDEIMLTQKTFRGLLQAMSHPGEIIQMDPIKTPVPTSPEIELLYPALLTLLDHEVGFTVIGPEKKKGETTIAELTGAQVKDSTEADFIIIFDSESSGEITQAKRGTLEYPDTGATVIYRVASLKTGEDARPRVRLTGPGIKPEGITIHPGLPSVELDLLKEINAEYPLGIDCLLIDPDRRLMGIPRSTRLEVF
jgi:alpha-D-ribose 1-methylphosphonate 5-triphosphate synthase subunit PhnH